MCECWACCTVDVCSKCVSVELVALLMYQTDVFECWACCTVDVSNKCVSVGLVAVLMYQTNV